MKKDDFSKILKENNLRITDGRLEVLSYLGKQKVPVSIKKIKQDIGGLDRVTLYRMMEQFEEKQIVRSCDLGHGHQDYELALDDHHHHVVCRDCGAIEDIELCGLDQIQQQMLSQSVKFSSIDQHRLTFMGTCNECI